MIAKQIKREEILPGLELATMRTGVRGVVSFQASLTAGSRFFIANSELADACAQMLLQGTKKYSKEKLHDTLESAAISVGISTTKTNTRVSGSLPVEQLEKFIDILSEVLQHPTFPETELRSFIDRRKAEIIESLKNTDRQAARTMRRAIFPKGHPNYSPLETQSIKDLESITPQSLHQFHVRNYGLGNLKIVITGDVEHAKWKKLLKKSFIDWQTLGQSIIQDDRSLKIESKIKRVNISDKTSADAYMGTPIKIDVRTREYYATALAVHILGGDFVSRLMSEVREKRGLTYGTRANIVDVVDGDMGLLYIWGTFAPALLPKGLSAISEVLSKFCKSGVSAKELARTKKALPGNFKVSLADSRGVAGTLLYILETNRPTTYIDDYPKLIESLTLSEVNAAIKKFINPNKFVTVVAGTI